MAPLYTHEYLRSLGARHLIIDEMDQAVNFIKHIETKAICYIFFQF